MSKLGQIGARLYRGDISIDFVGKWKRWYAISGAILLVAIGALVFNGLNYGIDFEGGVEFNAQYASGTNLAAQVKPVGDAITNTGLDAAQSPVVVVSGDKALRIDVESMTLADKGIVLNVIKSQPGVSEVNSTVIGPTWGASIAKKALTGLIVFVVLVVLLMWAYFREWRMSVAGMVALAHDLVITIGVYALTGFEVTPATVTGLLTILGYSLYDTVVVFDKVRENTKGIATSTRRTYADAANLAVNQTLVRSINTSLAALLPVGAILYVGTFQLGSGPLKDLALALFVGMAAGAYSSIFIATPLLANLKMRDPVMVAQAKKVANRLAHLAQTEAALVPAAATVGGRGASVSRPTATAPVEISSLDGPVSHDESSVTDLDATAADDTAIADDTTEDDVRPSAPSSRPPLPPSTRPTAPRPMSSNAAKRAQPQRQPRSKRGKR